MTYMTPTQGTPTHAYGSQMHDLRNSLRKSCQGHSLLAVVCFKQMGL